MVYLFQVLMKSGGTTVQRGKKNALTRKAKQVQFLLFFLDHTISKPHLQKDQIQFSDH
jgi:hypothetical protein